MNRIARQVAALFSRPAARSAPMSAHDRKRVADCRKKLLHLGAAIAPDGTLEIHGLKFLPSYPTFPIVLCEVLCAECYRFSMPGNWVAFDIGANAGAAALWLAHSENVRQVYAFEPVAPTFHMLAANLALNPRLAPKIQTLPLGLGSQRETLQVPYHPAYAQSVSSTHTFDSCFTPQSREKIQIEPAAEILAPLLARHPADKKFLKVDCEGAEFDILPNLAQAGLLPQFAVIILEWHANALQRPSVELQNHSKALQNHTPELQNHAKTPHFLTSLLESHGFFCFTEFTRRDHWQIGFIKAVNTKRLQ